VTDFSASVPYLPPSSNKIRTVVRNRIIYTSHANKYRKQFMQFMASNYVVDLQKFAKECKDDFVATYVIEITLYFPLAQLINKGWETGKAQSYYKTMDLGNREKLLNDCIIKSFGGVFDDNVYFDILLHKRCDDINPRVDFNITKLPSGEMFGIPVPKRRV